MPDLLRHSTVAKLHRSNVLIVSLAIVIVIVALVLGHDHRKLEAQPETLWMQHPAQEDSAWRSQFSSARAINYLNSLAPTFDQANFGPGTRTVFWRAPWVITGVFTTPSGLQYVIVSTSNHGGTGTFYDVGTLVNGHFTRIAIPDTSMQTTIEFVSPLIYGAPEVRVSTLGHPTVFYAIQGAGLIRVEGPTVSSTYRDQPAPMCNDLRATASLFLHLPFTDAPL
jgi:hypothetical protein